MIDPGRRSVLAHGHHSLALGYSLSGLLPLPVGQAKLDKISNRIRSE